LVCTNKADSFGQLHYIEPGGCCRNFQPFRKISRRQRAPLPHSDSTRYIPLTQGKFAIVDVDDYDKLAKYKWHCRKAKNLFYAFRSEGRKIVAMHRQIMNAPKGLVVDHIDSNGLNNRKSNLRLCTQAQNLHNKRPQHSKMYSKYKGVTWVKGCNKWRANICNSGKSIQLGYFIEETVAAVAYDQKAEQLFGEFAYLNFPQLA